MRGAQDDGAQEGQDDQARLVQQENTYSREEFSQMYFLAKGPVRTDVRSCPKAAPCENCK